MSNVTTKVRSKAIHVRISATLLAEAFMELLFFNKKVDRIRITMRRIGDPGSGNVYVSCSGRGTLKGRVVNGVFHGTINGTERQVKAWQRFFKKFVEVPEFSLKDYIAWLKQQNNNNS